MIHFLTVGEVAEGAGRSRLAPAAARKEHTWLAYASTVLLGQWDDRAIQVQHELRRLIVPD